MDTTDYKDVPNKKRRFLAPSDDDIHRSDGTNPFSSSPPSKRRFFQEDDDEFLPKARSTSSSASKRSPLSEKSLEDTFNRPVISPARSNSPPSNSSGAAPAFDQDTFEAFVGTKIKPEVLEIIQSHCGDSIERAVNMYFDGTWKNLKKKPTKPPVKSSPAIKTPARDSSATHTPSSLPTPTPLVVRRSVPESRYIGAFGVEGWATRSGTGLVKHGDLVKIERQKIQPPLIKGKGKLGAQPTVRANSAAAKRVDVVVRFTNSSGIEIGRLAKDAASWVSTLMDQKVCKFEGVCVYAPDRLRTNDTIFLQLRCSLLRSAFSSQVFQVEQDRPMNIFEEKESAEERELRLRQVALVRLFQEINLVPKAANAAAAQHQRQGLLEAAELTETKEKEAAKPGDRGEGDASTPEDEAEEGKELEQDQLDALYKKAQSFDFNTPEAEPPDSFAMTLRPYQKQSLYWMISKEKDRKARDGAVSMHPLWEEYTWPTKDVDDKELPQIRDQASFYVNPYSGELSLDFPAQEQHCLGGILADEMGLGKTIQMLSLIHSHKSPAAIEARRLTSGITNVNDLTRLSSSSADVVSAPCTTLVIAPMSLLAQWQSEAENASVEGTLKSMVYYGVDKISNLQSLCAESNAASAPDVVITSYGVVLSEFSQISAKKGDKKGHRGLFSLNFFRVILDEAHTIKNRQAKTAKACYALEAEHRWVLTGTPIVNRLEDLFSLVRFLQVEPWNNFSFWKTFITVPFESKDFMRALDVVQTVLEPLVMRRTKDMKTPDGQPLVALPAKHVEILEVELSKTEKAVYDYIYTRARHTFYSNMQAGTVLKAYTSIFAQILRLRQSCCHPILVRNQDIVADEEEAGAAADVAAGLADDMDLHTLIERFQETTEDGTGVNAFGAHVLGQIRDEAANECPICAEEPMIDQTVTGCWHSACRKCILAYIEHQTDRHEVPRCFHCREPINSRDLFEVVRHDDDPESSAESPRISLQRLGVTNSSSKVVALLQQLRALRKEHPKMKSVVFSQFTSFMSLIEPALQRVNMKFLRLDGSMAQKARAAVLDEFRQSNKFTILLLSLRAGGVGLNLTTAKRVYMMDPWWSFAVEAQAIDRVHRMGQEDEVRVYRFIVKDSVEQRMLKIQDRKKFIATSLGMMTDEERKLQRIEDIKDLLG